MTRLRSVCAILVICIVGVFLGKSDMSAGRSELCRNICGESEDCLETCYPTQFDFDQDINQTTCGEYEGGWLGDPPMCDPATADSCSFECYNASSGTQCTSGAASTTCGSYGVTSTCGNDICDVDDGETNASCSSDCAIVGGAVTGPTSQQEAEDQLPFWEDIDDLLEDGGESLEDLGRLWEYFYAESWVSESSLDIDFELDDLVPACGGDVCVQDVRIAIWFSVRWA